MKRDDPRMKGSAKTIILVSSIIFILSAVVAFAGTNTYDYILTWYDGNGNAVNNVHALNYECSDANCATLGNMDQEVFSGASNSVAINYSIPSPAYGYGTYWFASCYRPMEMAWKPSRTGMYAENGTFQKHAICVSNMTELSADIALNQPSLITVKVNSPTISGNNTAPLAEPASQDIRDNFYSLSTKVDLVVKKGATTIYTDSKTVPVHRDGTSTVQFTWTPTEYGNYTITVSSASIDCKCSSQAPASTKSISKKINMPPNAEAGGPYVGNEGSVITLSASGSSDTDGTIVKYEWDLNNDAVYEKTATVPTITNTWNDDFSGTIKLRVTDNDGATATDTASVAISNVAPTANAGGPYSGNEGSAVQFNGSQTDPGADTFTYLWNFGDGSTSTLKNPTHVYADNGVYNVTFTVTDDDGGVGTAKTTATISNVAPTASASNNGPKPEGTAVTVTAGQTDPGVLDTFAYSFDWNNDAVYEIIDQVANNAQNTWYDNGNYVVRVRVKDKDGGIGTATTTVVVTNVAPVVDVTGPEQAKINTVVTFTGTFTDPGADTWTCKWDFGDGINTSFVACTSPTTKTHTYTSIGNFTVTLIVKDDDNGTGNDTFRIKIIPRNLPVANPNGPYSGKEGIAVVLNGSGSYDPEGMNITSYKWDTDSDMDYADATGIITTYTWPDNYNGNVCLKITTSDSATGTACTTANIANVNPTCDAGPAKNGNEGSAVSFTGTASDVPADTLSYSWNFGDGTNTSGMLAPSHTYADNGIYTVTLTVRDKDGGQCIDTTNATISNVAPTVNVGPDRTAKINKPMQFNATFTDPGADTWTCKWAFGDGATVSGACTSPTTATHTYTALGSFTVVLNVTDKDSGVGSDSLQLTIVTTDPPVAEANGPYSGDEGKPIQFNSSGSHVVEGGATITSYSWTFGDGSTSSEANPKHTYGDNGAYAVVLTVTDSFGKTGTDTATANIANANPVCDAGAGKSGNEGSSIYFSGSASDVPADTLSYSWIFGDGTNATGTLTPSHVYNDNGNYVVTLTVTDKDGGQCNDTTNATISNVGPVAEAGGPYAGSADIPVSFSGTFTDAGSADTHECKWNFGDGAITDFASCTSPNAVSHTYSDNGTYIVTLTVKDDDSAVGSDTATANIAPFQGTRVFVNPATKDANLNDRFTLGVDIRTTEEVYGSAITLLFNSGVLNLYEAKEGDFLKKDGAYTFFFSTTNAPGNVTIINARLSVPNGVTGRGTLVNITFDAITSGSSPINIDNTVVQDPNAITIANVSVINGVVNVGSSVHALTGDVNKDEKVGVTDLVLTGKAYGSRPGSSNWNWGADSSGDYKVDLSDLIIVARNYGRSL